jgi:hypothetical protein
MAPKAKGKAAAQLTDEQLEAQHAHEAVLQSAIDTGVSQASLHMMHSSSAAWLWAPPQPRLTTSNRRN